MSAIEGAILQTNVNSQISEKELEINKLNKEGEELILAKIKLLEESDALQKEYDDIQSKLPPYLRDKNFVLIFFIAGFSFKKDFKINRKKIILFLRLLSLSLSVILFFHPTPLGVELLDLFRLI